MPDQVDDQCFTDFVRNAFILQELVNVKEISWMLPIKRREIGQIDINR